MNRALVKLLSWCSLLIAGCSNPPSAGADLILYNARIVTVDTEFTIAEAVAVRQGRILALGTDEEILPLGAEHTERMDLGGQTVVPGFIDSHAHPTAYGMSVVWPDLSKVSGIQDILTIVEHKVDEAGPGEWITNSRFWNEEKLKERRNPTRQDLDPVSPDNPVFLTRGHLGIINSEAMRRLGIHKQTPDPPGGRIERDPATGELTGRLYETALDQVREAIPAATHQQLMDAQRHSLGEMAAAGITSLRSAGHGAGDSGSGSTGADAMRAFMDLHKRGELPLRTSVTIRINPNDPYQELETFFRDTPAASGLGDEMLRIWGIKMTADGGSDLAYLRKDYANRPGFRGQLGGTFENFLGAARLANRFGWRVGIHALGDAGVDFVLDVYEAVDREETILGKRWSIEHGYFLQPEHFDRIRKLGLILHPQTWHFYHLRRNFVQNYGAEYADMSHPYRTLIDNRIPIAGGMDWYVQPSDIFFYMWVAITRKTLDGEVVGYDQRLTREEALRFHTIWAAQSTLEEESKGSLEAGKLADMVVLSADYLTVPEDAIKEIHPVLTLVGGGVVFRKD